MLYFYLSIFDTALALFSSYLQTDVRVRRAAAASCVIPLLPCINERTLFSAPTPSGHVLYCTFKIDNRWSF